VAGNASWLIFSVFGNAGPLDFFPESNLRTRGRFTGYMFPLKPPLQLSINHLVFNGTDVRKPCHSNGQFGR